ncbi:hypothetical protein ATCC90586_003749 [Pythium insidiosum]|nr:hypothetical protein ATCC90586_003749 [Pythium insidiosum]
MIAAVARRSLALSSASASVLSGSGRALKSVHVHPHAAPPVLARNMLRVRAPMPKTPSALAPHARAYGGGSGYGNQFFDSADRVVYALIGANVVVYGLWATADTPMMRHRMVTYFTSSARHLDHGHYHTLLTAAFSHADGTHLFTNMLGLFFFGREISYLLGPKRFLGLYLVSGVVSSWAAVQEQRLARRQTLNLGASGAVNSITALSILLYPHSTLLIFGIVPIPAWIAGSMFIGRDLYGWLQGNMDGIGHVAHLSGAACGGLYFAYLRRGMRMFR